MATREQVRTMQTRQPFRPFVVKLVDGRSLRVNHPEVISCSLNGRELVVHDEDGMHLVEMLLVHEIAPVPTDSPKVGGNGA